MSTKGLLKLNHKNPSFKLTTKPVVEQELVVDIIQTGISGILESDCDLVVDEEGKHIVVAISTLIGGACVSEKFADVYNKKILEAKNSVENGHKYRHRQLIEKTKHFSNALSLPDDCSRNDVILIKSMRQFWDRNDMSFNGELFPGIQTSAWKLCLIPVEHASKFRILLLDGGKEMIDY